MSDGINIVTPVGEIGINTVEQEKKPEESTTEKIGWLVLGALITSIVGYVGVKAIQALAEGKSVKDKTKTEEYI